MEKDIDVHARPFHVKDGIKTTEFYLALGVVALAVAAVGIHLRSGGFDVTSAVAIGAAALTSIGYSRARSLAKSGH